MVILGPRSAGKTTVGRGVAEEIGIFHISFQEYLQEEVLPKMKKPPLVEENDWDPPEGEEGDKQDAEGMVHAMLPPPLAIQKEHINPHAVQVPLDFYWQFLYFIFLYCCIGHVCR